MTALLSAGNRHLTLAVSLILVGILALIVVGLILYFRTPKGRGVLGEWQVKNRLKSIFGREEVVLNNFICVDDEYKSFLHRKHKKTVQIDHIAVCKKGVLVIETKNYAGKIYGNAKDREWTQTLSQGKVKNKLHNPIIQNETHCYYVRKCIGREVPIRSLVVFINNNEGHLVGAEEVVGLKDLARYVRALPDTLRGEEIAAIAEKLKAADQSDKISERQHTENVKNLMKDLEEGVCPRCGAPLVLKEGESEEYYECSEAPRCKFVKKI